MDASSAMPMQGDGASRRLSIAIILLLIVSVLLMGLGSYFGILWWNENKKTEQMRQLVNQQTFYTGITINGIDVAGMTKEEAIEKISTQLAKQDEALQMVLNYSVK